MMIESLMFELLAGAAKGAASSLASGAADATKPTEGSMFSKMYDQISENHQTTKERLGKRAEDNETYAKPEQCVYCDKNNEKPSKPDQVERNDDSRPAEKVDSEMETRASDIRDTRDAIEKVSERIETLKAENPEAFNEIAENIDNMSMGDLLKSLGFNAEEIASFDKVFDLNAALGEDMKQAFLSGDTVAIAEVMAGLVKESGLLSSGNSNQGPLAEVVAAGNQEKLGANQKVEQPTNSAENKPDPESRFHSSLSEKKDGAAGKVADGSKQASSQKPNEAAMTNLGENMQDKPIAAKEAVLAASQNSQKVAASGRAETSSINTTQIKTSSDATNSTENIDRTATTRRTFERYIANQVIDNVRVLVKNNGTSQMTMRLDPPNLGKVDLRVMVQDNSVKAVMIAESREVRAAIEGNIEQLKQTLMSNGLKVDEISVTTASDGRGFAFGNPNSDGQGNGSAAKNSSGLSAYADGDLDDGQYDIAAIRRSAHDGVLSVVA